MQKFWIEELETLPARELLARQLAMAAAQTSRAARDSEFYRSRFDDVPSGGFAFADLDAFATAVASTSKEQVIAAQLANPPYGGLLAVPEDDLVRHYVYPAGQVLGWTAVDHAALEDMYAAGCMPPASAAPTVSTSRSSTTGSSRARSGMLPHVTSALL